MNEREDKAKRWRKSVECPINWRFYESVILDLFSLHVRPSSGNHLLVFSLKLSKPLSFWTPCAFEILSRSHKIFFSKACKWVIFHGVWSQFQVVLNKCRNRCRKIWLRSNDPNCESGDPTGDLGPSQRWSFGGSPIAIATFYPRHRWTIADHGRNLKILKRSERRKMLLTSSFIQYKW